MMSMQASFYQLTTHKPLIPGLFATIVTHFVIHETFQTILRLWYDYQCTEPSIVPHQTNAILSY